MDRYFTPAPTYLNPVNGKPAHWTLLVCHPDGTARSYYRDRPSCLHEANIDWIARYEKNVERGLVIELTHEEVLAQGFFQQDKPRTAAEVW
jgi:hypothetical protein